MPNGKIGRPESNAQERFWSKVNKTEECWLWTSGLTHSGYGAFWYKGKTHPASRMAYIFEHGPIPKEKVVCHTCDNPKCVRIDHLWLGTIAENQTDAQRKGRFPKGENCHLSRITDLKKKELLDRWINGEKRVALANEYNITPQAVFYIIKTHKDKLINAPKNEIYKKLNPEKHLEILKRFNDGETQRKLAQEYGIRPSTMGWIIRHKFKHKTTR